ncbi:MAG: diguanylate cyclase [Ruminococcaceae bacterium]|nr:diguanylate cyclase [Oscillospiraceae bacterium]
MVNENVIKSLKERRSVRSYKSEQITDEMLDIILEVGTFAPTGRNLQSPLMVAVRDKETIKKLSEMNAAVMGSDRDPFYGAPCVVVVFADPSVYTYIEDGSLVMGNLLNAAYACGLGGCWIHRAKEVFETQAGKKLMREWGVDEKYVGIGNCILGYADGDLPIARPRKDGYIIKIG